MNYLPYFGEKKDNFIEESCNNTSTTTIEKNIVSKKLVVHDILMLLKKERKSLIPILSSIYGINFKLDIEFTKAITFTSQKCIIIDNEGNKYFLKEKPFYSLNGDAPEKALLAQSVLSKKTDFVPGIIPTLNGDYYCKIGQKTYILTPFIEGKNFSGKIIESKESAKTLGIIHKILNNELKSYGTNVSAYNNAMFFIELMEKNNYKNKVLHKKVVNGLKTLALKYKDKLPQKSSWLHGDFTPFNLIFNEKGQVIGVNDFDNVNYGSISRDIGECILTHTGFLYAGETSSFRPPIPTFFGTNRMNLILKAYLEENLLTNNELGDLGVHTILIWIESLSLGLVRGDYSLEDVEKVLYFGDNIVETFNSII